MIFKDVHTHHPPFNETITVTHVLRTFGPYITVLLLLVLTRVPVLGVFDFLQQYTVSIENIFGTTVSHSMSLVYSPGLIFILVGLCSLLVYRITLKDGYKTLVHSLSHVLAPVLSLFFILSIVQILIHSGENERGLLSVPLYLAEMAAVSQVAWPFFAPFIGALGAFMTGSSTVSNLLFSSLQTEAASTYGFSVVLLLSLQAVGSALGNMISLHNIVTAQVSVRLKHAEGKILRYTILPALFLLTAAGVMGLVLSLLML